MKIFIKNGHILDPARALSAKGNILIEDGRIAEISLTHSASVNADKVIDASGMYVVPGLIDLHTHLREPGFEHKETIMSGTAAAVRGGFTTVCCMPNTRPVIDSEAVVSFIMQKAALSSCDVLPIGAITKGQEGRELTDFAMLTKAGCCAFSDDGKPVVNSRLMRRALELSAELGFLVIAHCEDMDLAEGGVINEGNVSRELGLKGIPAEAEDIITARDIMLARLTGGRLHIAHVSTKYSVELVRRAKADGVQITAETCPHYFSITEEAVRSFGTNAKVNPPLRTVADVAAIKEGLRDGTIDAIATDHAPHHADEKALGFEKAPFGISGLETALSLGLSLVREGVISMERLVQLMSTNPASILGINRGTLEVGSEADILIINPEADYKVNARGFASQGRNTPFEGMQLKGRPAITISRGRIFDIPEGMTL